MSNDVIGWYDERGKLGTWRCDLCGATGNGRRSAWAAHYATTHTDPKDPHA